MFTMRAKEEVKRGEGILYWYQYQSTWYSFLLLQMMILLYALGLTTPLFPSLFVDTFSWGLLYELRVWTRPIN